MLHVIKKIHINSATSSLNEVPEGLSDRGCFIKGFIKFMYWSNGSTKGGHEFVMTHIDWGKMTGVTRSDCTNNDKEKGMAHALPMVIPASSSHGEKLEKFNGTDFKRWQQKMLFYLTTLYLAKFLKEDAHATGTTTEAVAATNAWYHSDFLSKNYILNGLDNTLHNVYSPIKTAKVLWESFDKKYKTKDMLA
ncbi:unnamed protein product [Prunus armeniaca]